ncbi:hypothetical protein EROP_12690 [Erysipelotrichaceae bacterium OPF54]|nr:hypothetical protein EROP_12690 [Erysipelotrichaceae bacterium OPF54]
MQKSKNNAYNPKEKGPLFARSISQTGAFNYTRFFFPLTFEVMLFVLGQTHSKTQLI